MKVFTILLIIFAIPVSGLKAQVAINRDGSAPNASSMLDLKSPSKGMLVPRMTNIQRDAISGPAVGLIIYNTNEHAHQMFDGTRWSTLVAADCIPSPPGNILGNVNPVCHQTGLIYSITGVAWASSYHWTVPGDAVISAGQGTTSIIVNMGVISGNVSVRAESGCGNSTYANLAINVIVIPPQPGIITGNSNPECLASTSYSIVSVAGANSYFWTVPGGATITSGQGTTSIVVNFGTSSGNVSVRSVNSCGNSAFSNLGITIGIPSQPGPISGNTLANTAYPVTYSISSIPGATYYSWVVPTGATIASGQGTSSIMVNFGSQSGNVSVRAQNSCGNSGYTHLAITLFTCGTVYTDIRDNKTYSTVQIGSQCWFSQNLNTGTLVSLAGNQANNGIIEKYCNGDSETNCNTYGGLYQWDEVMQYTTTQGTQGICPAGWHIPTQGEYTSLVTFLGGTGIAGGKMKETGTAHWLSPNTGATNSSGFTGLPGGFRFHVDGTSIQLGQYGYFWSSTQNDGTHKWYRQLYNSDANAAENNTWKYNGFSVRCLLGNL